MYQWTNTFLKDLVSEYSHREYISQINKECKFSAEVKVNIMQFTERIYSSVKI